MACLHGYKKAIDSSEMRFGTPLCFTLKQSRPLERPHSLYRAVSRPPVPGLLSMLPHTREKKTIATRKTTTQEKGPTRERGPRINHQIRISPIRVIGADNSQVGVIEVEEARRMAEEAGLDLVEVSPEARPPVCKIMDYVNYKYDRSKKQRKNRSASKAQELKQIRLGRSVKIDPHDVEIRVNQARKVLEAGHKVQITQRFRGREIAHNRLGIERLEEIVKVLADIAKVESTPKLQGRQASMILAPDKIPVRPSSVDSGNNSIDDDDADDDDDDNDDD